MGSGERQVNVTCSAGDEESRPAAFLRAVNVPRINLLCSIHHFHSRSCDSYGKIGASLSSLVGIGCLISPVADCFHAGRFRWARSHAPLIASRVLSSDPDN